MASMSVCPKALTRAVFKIFLLLTLTFPSPADAEQPGETSVVPAPGSTVDWPPTAIRILHRSPNSAPAVGIRLLLASSGTPLHIVPSVEVVDGVQLVQVPQLTNGSYTFSYVHNGIRASQSFEVLISRNIPNELVGALGSSESWLPSWLVPAVVGVMAAAMFMVLYVVRLRKLSKFRRRAYLVSFWLFLAAAGSIFPFLVQNTAVQDEEACLLLYSVNRNECLAEMGLGIFSAEGVPAVMLFLEDLDADPRFVSRNGEHVCHEVAHLVGQKILQSALDVTASLKGSSGVCGLGYIHGVGEAAARHVPTDDVYRHLASLCYDKEVFSGDDRSTRQCAHGFGHAVAVRTNVSFAESVALCDENLVGTALEDSCVEAVAMVSGEWIANQIIRTRSFTASLPRNYPSGDLLLWCSILESRPSSHAACMRGLASVYKGSVEGLAYLPEEYRTPQSLMGSCPRLGASADNCYAASGTAAVNYEPNSTDSYSNLCDSIASLSGRSACYYGMVAQAILITDNSADQDGFVGSICVKSRDPDACRDEVSKATATLIQVGAL